MQTLDKYIKLWKVLNEMVLDNFNPLPKNTWYKLDLNIKQDETGEVYLSNVCLVLDDKMPLRFIQVKPKETKK